MAQACAMLQPRDQQQQQQLCTPGKQPLSPQLDTSLITSAARKRKGECGLPVGGWVMVALPRALQHWAAA